MEPERPPAYSYIRMSTAIQLRGDSLRRQLEKTREFAVKHNLELNEQLSGRDIGVSAFRGKNAVDGALGKILEAIKDGRIASGSWLLVESLDRISRQDALKAVHLFSEILNAGVVVATTSNGTIYRKNVDPGQLFMMLGEFLRSHSESQTKQYRGLEKWDIKRRNAHLKKLTAMCPRWLVLEPNGSFSMIPERVDVVRRIFDDATTGIGIAVTAMRLNDERVPAFDRDHHVKKSDGWHTSYIHKILTNRAVLGEFQPHKREGGKSVPAGPAIENYFPQIISADKFHEAAAQRKVRLQNGRGRKGKAFTNLFAGMLRCQYCSRRIHFENKGDGPKGGKYLICEGAFRNVSCEKVRWRYDHFEASFLAFVEEIDLGALYTEGATAQARSLLSSRNQAIDGQVGSLKKAQEALIELAKIQGMDKIAVIGEQLAKHQVQIDELDSEKVLNGEKLDSMFEAARQYYESKSRVKELIARLRSGESTDLFKERAQIASRLGAIIDRIVLAPSGDLPARQELARKLLRIANDQGDDELSQMANELSSQPNASDTSGRYFTAIFKDGRSRKVTPHDNDPLRFHQMIVDGPGGSQHIEVIGSLEIEISNRDR